MKNVAFLLGHPVFYSFCSFFNLTQFLLFYLFCCFIDFLMLIDFVAYIIFVYFCYVLLFFLFIYPTVVFLFSLVRWFVFVPALQLLFFTMYFSLTSLFDGFTV